MVKIPGEDAVELPLSILASFDGRPSHVDRGVSVQPLLAEHREEGGEERGGEACVQNGLDLDSRGIRTGPLWDRGGVAEHRIIQLINNDTEEGDGLLVRVRVELRLDLGDEHRSDGGEQTSLWDKSGKVHEYGFRRTNISVVFRSSSYFFINSLS